MFHIKTFVAPSTVHGTGVFAAEDIEKGKLVWSFNPKIDFAFSEAEWVELLESLSPACKEVILNYAYKEKNTHYILADHGQFMNHHRARANLSSDSDANTMHALFDIAKGEELLCDYGDYSDDDDILLNNVKRAEGKS